jgi:hypothetical protein
MGEGKNKISSIFKWLISVSILLNGLCSLCFNALNRHPVFNEYTIYIQAIMPILLELVTISAIVVFICKYKKLAKKLQCWIFIILIVISSILWNIADADYLKDIFTEPKTISSDFYEYNKNLIIYNEDDGSPVVLKIYDDKQSTLVRQGLIVDKNKLLKISEHISVYGMEKTILVTYYPNTKITKDIKFVY